MRLLLDENISWRVAPLLRPHVATAEHVRDLGLESSPDTAIWRYAREHDLHIVTKDEDFVRLLLTRGFPPKVVVVTNAQVPAKKLAAYLVEQLPRIHGFLTEEPGAGMLVLRLA